MERFHMDFHGFDYQLHSDLEDELMGCELPCPGKRRAPARADVLAQQEPSDEPMDPLDPLEDDIEEPDDPDHAGFPDEDEGSCEDACEVVPDEDPQEGGDQDPDDLFFDEDPEDDGSVSESEDS